MVRVKIIFVLMFLLALASQPFAQSRKTTSEQLPVDKLTNLDSSVLSDAIVGIVNEGKDDEFEVNQQPYQKLYFSKGFKILFLERCQMSIRNEESVVTEGFIGYLQRYKDLADFFGTAESTAAPHAIRITLPLNEMSYKKGRKAYLLTEEPERAAKYGNWRVQLKTKGEFNEIRVHAANGDLEQSTTGGLVTFSFSDEAKSKLFDSTVRAAIRACSK